MTSQILTPSGFGRRLSGFRVARASDADLAGLRDLWLESGGLLVIPGQDDLPPAGFLRLCAAFGPRERNEKYNPRFLLPGHPEILRLGNLRQNGELRALFVRAEAGGPVLWHSDDTFRHPQPAGSALHCLAHPREGGGTWYAGMEQAWEELPDRLRRRAAGRFAVHSYLFLDERLRKTNPHRAPLPESVRRGHPPVIRPLVTRHPEHGRRALMVPECHIASVSGLSAADGRSLIAELMRHATGIRYRYRHDWAPGDVAVWDNRSAMHAPSPFDEREPRLLHRVTFRGPDALSAGPRQRAPRRR